MRQPTRWGEAPLNRNDLNDATEQFYADRLKNNVHLCVAHFTNSARLELPGLESGEYLGRPEIRGLFEVFIANWRWETWTPLQKIVDGQTVAVRYRLETLYLPTSERLTTQIMDQITFDQDLKIIQLIQFLDTATFLRLSASGP